MATNKDTLLKAMSQATEAESKPDTSVQQAMQRTATNTNQQTANPQSTGVQKSNAETMGNAMATVSKNDTQPTPQEVQQKAYMSDNLSNGDILNVRSNEDRQAIIDAKRQWAEATNDDARTMAREVAERTRAKYGYSGGSDGSQNIRLNETDMKMSDDDKYTLLQYKNQWNDAYAKGDKAGMEAANKAAQKLRAKYGYVANPVTGEESTPLGLFTDPNSKKQYVATVDGDFVRTDPNPITITDSDGKKITLTDTNGNTLTSDMLVMGADGRIYVAATGQRLIDLAEQYGIDDSNVRFLVNGNYYTVTGFNTKDKMGALGIDEWTDNPTYNTLYQELSKLGLERTPYLKDYDTLDWDQALARATQQLNGQYNKALQDSLDNINRAALKTGFFGQLPTEALKAQATASTELERQSAINELASTLMNDSRNYAQQQYEDDTKSVQQQMDTIMQLYNYLYKLNQDAINNEEDQTRLDQAQQQIDITKEQGRLELLLEAAKIVDQLAAEGYGAAQVSAWLSAQE